MAPSSPDGNSFFFFFLVIGLAWIGSAGTSFDSGTPSSTDTIATDGQKREREKEIDN